MDRLFFVLGCVSAGLGVAFGAFGAHALKARLAPDLLAVYEVGVRYQLVHALARAGRARPSPRAAGCSWAARCCSRAACMRSA